MWVYSKSRGEHDNRFMVNLDQVSRINVSQLGGKWFLEVILGSESFPVAAAASREEVLLILARIFDGIQAGERALDLDATRGMEAPFRGTSSAADSRDAVIAVPRNS
jgi:hypothetical protein